MAEYVYRDQDDDELEKYLSCKHQVSSTASTRWLPSTLAAQHTYPFTVRAQKRSRHVSRVRPGPKAIITPHSPARGRPDRSSASSMSSTVAEEQLPCSRSTCRSEERRV